MIIVPETPEKREARMNPKPRNPAGGQTAGDIELLMDPSTLMVIASEDFALSAFSTYQAQKEAFPAFHYGLAQARIRAQKAQWRRSEMPVIDEKDLPALKDMLRENGYLSLCDACTITPQEANPSQCQIYVDKSIKGTAKAGVASTLGFLKSNHLVISKDGYIVDGHHRWLTAYMMDPAMVLPAFRAPANLADIWPAVLAFSDARHARNA